MRWNFLPVWVLFIQAAGFALEAHFLPDALPLAECGTKQERFEF